MILIYYINTYQYFITTYCLHVSVSPIFRPQKPSKPSSVEPEEPEEPSKPEAAMHLPKRPPQPDAEAANSWGSPPVSSMEITRKNEGLPWFAHEKIIGENFRLP